MAPADRRLPRRPLAHDCFGRTYTDIEIEQALTRDPRSGLVERRRTPYWWRRESDIAATAAQMIAAGKIIGWFQGGSELGPRVLGARSILADPRTTAGSDALNNRIKHREPFRPFAPAVLANHAMDRFDLDVPSPFMLLAPPACEASDGDGSLGRNPIYQGLSPRCQPNRPATAASCKGLGPSTLSVSPIIGRGASPGDFPVR
jgi:predicted NodU family carbamoyl transferase